MSTYFGFGLSNALGPEGRSQDPYQGGDFAASSGGSWTTQRGNYMYLPFLGMVFIPNPNGSSFRRYYEGGDQTGGGGGGGGGLFKSKQWDIFGAAKDAMGTLFNLPQKGGDSGDAGFGPFPQSYLMWIILGGFAVAAIVIAKD
jgi:hypothetical protein